MKPLQRIAVIGGGTAGWIAASILANELKDRCRVDLVESEEIGTVGVGESTIPPFLELLKTLGIDEKDFIQKTQASFKLGIQFVDWHTLGEAYFHPFGSITAGMDEFTFYQSWLKSLSEGRNYSLQSFSPSNAMAKSGKFVLPHAAGKTPVSEARYALHLDAKLASTYLRNYAESREVVRTEGKVIDVIANSNKRIDKVILEDGREIEADFFIDCTGFRALLIAKALGSDYRDWSHYLPCNKAVTVQTSSLEDTPPYTKATAHKAGWMWRIPLQQRVGNGYVYCTDFCSDDEALETLLAAVEGELLTKPQFIPFKTGVRDEIWKGNCLSLGLASGFIEPLESTAIHLVVRGMVHFMRHFPDLECDPELAVEYNRRMHMDYEEIRDFVVLHYCLTERDDTPFWRWHKNMKWPESLTKTIDYFKVQGNLPQIVDPLFTPVSWRSICEGMGLRPKKYSHLVNELDFQDVCRHFDTYLDISAKVVASLPSHQSFLTRHCPAAT